MVELIAETHQNNDYFGYTPVIKVDGEIVFTGETLDKGDNPHREALNAAFEEAEKRGLL